MADKKLNIKVGTKGTEKAKKKLKGVEGGLKSLGKQAMVAGAAFFGARAIVGGLKAVIKLAGEQEQAEKKLETALGRTSQALLNHASSLQKVTTFGDEAIIGVQASLAAFLDSEDAIKKATEATLDISVAMGMDLKAAGDLVAKTLGSSTNAMSRYGIQVEGAVGSTERLESLTGNVAKLFGGQATAQAETMAGAMAQADNAAGDLGEAIGKKLAPMITDIANGMTSFTVALTEFIEISEEERIKQLERAIADLEITMRLTGVIADENVGFFKKLMMMQSGVAGATTLTNEQLLEQEIRLQALRDELESLTTIQAPEDKKEQIEAQKAMSDELLNSQDIVETGWLPALRAWNFELEKINSITNSFSEETSPVMIDALGGIWAQISQGAPFLKSISDGFVNVDTASADATGNMMGSLSALNEATAGSGKKSKLWAKTQKALLVGESIMHTYSAAIKMLDPKYGGAPPLNYIQSAAVVTAGLANLINIKSQKFAKGGEFVTNKPEMIMVGEAGREHVKITPIDRPEDRALKGGDIVLNISAPLVDETVVNSIIPAIEKAQRLNLA